jgi:putative phosphoribosyl transferase
MPKFKDREDAGRQLACQLSVWKAQNPVVMGIPRGGIPVAAPVAQSFNLPLLLLPMRRLQVPWDTKIVFGYVTDEGGVHLNQPLIGQVRLTVPEVQKIARREQLNLQKDLSTWGAPPITPLEEQTVLLIDDGMHTGWTLFSALEMLRARGARRILAAVPVTHFRAKRFVGRH